MCPPGGTWPPGSGRSRLTASCSPCLALVAMRPSHSGQQKCPTSGLPSPRPAAQARAPPQNAVFSYGPCKHLAQNGSASRSCMFAKSGNGTDQNLASSNHPRPTPAHSCASYDRDGLLRSRRTLHLLYAGTTPVNPGPTAYLGLGYDHAPPPSYLGPILPARYVGPARHASIGGSGDGPRTLLGPVLLRTTKLDKIKNTHLHTDWVVAKRRCSTRGKWVWIQVARKTPRVPTLILRSSASLRFDILQRIYNRVSTSRIGVNSLLQSL